MVVDDDFAEAALGREPLPARVLVVGNSGSGKSTLAASLARQHGWVHIDLDTVAWSDASPPVREDVARSIQRVESAVQGREGWVVEGCYADLLTRLAPAATHLLFIDRSVATCTRYARQRPWEPHKFTSLQEQNDHLSMLLDWIRDDPQRPGPLGRQAHAALFDAFDGQKHRITDDTDALPSPNWFGRPAAPT